jgi:hypothetical protein
MKKKNGLLQIVIRCTICHNVHHNELFLPRFIYENVDIMFIREFGVISKLNEEEEWIITNIFLRFFENSSDGKYSSLSKINRQ